MEHIHGSHDKLLVFFSIIIAVAASYTVLELAGRVGTAKGRQRWQWIVSGAVIMGMGVWSTHFVGMLALELPFPVAYNITVVVLSVAVAIVASFIALFVISTRNPGMRRLLGGGVLLALGIAGMHYIGMVAMQIEVRYKPGYVILSVIIAFAASFGALGLSSYIMKGEPQRYWKKIICGLIMGAAILGMHYTGMMSANFMPNHHNAAVSGVFLDKKWLAYVIAGGTLFTLGLSMHGIYISRRFSHHETEIMVNEKWYKSLYENNQDGILSIGLNQRIIGFNRAAAQIIGVSSDLLQNQTLDFLRQIVAEEDRERMHDVFSSAFEGKEVSYETGIVHQDGRRVEVNVINAPVMVDGQVVGTYVIARDVTEEKRIKEKNHYLAFHDELTGLPNRRMFNQLLSQTIEKHSGKQEPFAVIAMDLDRFKFINDSLGHLYGDFFLQEMSCRIRNSVVNENVTLARMGGDEFAMLCRFTRKNMNVTAIAEQMIRAIEKPFHLKDRDFYITASIGIAFFPDHGQDAAELLKNADTAMYEVKKNGRNDYHFFSDDMNGQLAEQLELEGDLRKALENGELMLHYQPQMEADSNQIIGVEALVRWQHPHRGLLSPAIFIPLAEETGQIAEIGNWVLREACRQMRQWHEAGGPRIPVAVNLSSQQFHQYNLVDEIRQILEETGLAPEYLELEITESMMMNASVSAGILGRLARIGIRISLDDFGTGYSSLSYLKMYPIHKLKIDRSFIKDIAVSSNDRAMMATIITMARNLNMHVIAEGIETREQLDILVSNGCSEIQGYYFSRPLPPEELKERFLLALQSI
ncbi:PAS domain S-box protein [Paenibacillus sp. PK3_47]|uniref:bifunctional diguanylate cyclase/phosphodiesterase n=1 Tax=Paenibacillus sp. PK3_47 TaxID=2072642 RepID=UPI00201DEC05|nr:EAL domain-containing protein [Paenibacillus sp. PK3_47]UQZ32960.1 PAS domain S-box protein [Paenibacillus sp. PK3_47]